MGRRPGPSGGTVRLNLVVSLAGAVLGLAFAAGFDWVGVAMLGKTLLPTAKERRQAFLLHFAWHGPWFGLAFPLLVSGGLATPLRPLGLAEPIAGLASMVAFAAIGGAVIWLAHQLPAVKEAGVAVRGKMNAAHAEKNQRWGRFLMASPRPAAKPSDRKTPTDV